MSPSEDLSIEFGGFSKLLRLERKEEGREENKRRKKEGQS
jgi:hypothetical protein